MKIRIVCFSEMGEALGKKLELGEVTRIRHQGPISLGRWTEDGFREADALIFIGACAIAVRAIAPFVSSKLTDPAVLVIDETGRFVISLLSGHIGGANALAKIAAQKTGAIEVVTTGTDRRNTFSADSWAAENGFGIINPKAVLGISSAVLDGKELVLSVRDKEGNDEKTPEELVLVPRMLVLGAGCRRGTDPERMKQAFQDFCEAHKILSARIGAVASIDLKKDEPALWQLAGSLKAPFLTYSAKELAGVEGTFSSSDFVLRTAGVDNVCERAAVKASGGKLILAKEVYEGITFALAKAEHVTRWIWK